MLLIGHHNSFFLDAIREYLFSIALVIVLISTILFILFQTVKVIKLYLIVSLFLLISIILIRVYFINTYVSTCGDKMENIIIGKHPLNNLVVQELMKNSNPSDLLLSSNCNPYLIWADVKEITTIYIFIDISFLIIIFISIMFILYSFSFSKRD